MSQQRDADGIRQRLRDIRIEFRRLLDADRPPRNKAVFYSGTSESLKDFRVYLGRKSSVFSDAMNLEESLAGKYLQQVTREELKKILPSDYNERRKFDLGGGQHFSASINGFWRDLSARFARACSGVVHVLVANDRTRIHLRGLQLWATGNRFHGFLNELKVFGFVEFPILVGALSENEGVTAVNIYVEPTNGSFELLKGGQFIISDRPGRA